MTDKEKQNIHSSLHLVVGCIALQCIVEFVLSYYQCRPWLSLQCIEMVCKLYRLLANRRSCAEIRLISLVCLAACVVWKGGRKGKEGLDRDNVYMWLDRATSSVKKEISVNICLCSFVFPALRMACAWLLNNENLLSISTRGPSNT